MKTIDLSFVLTSRYKWVLSISLAIFFYLFMVIFLPFGVTNYDPNFRLSFEFFLMLFFFCGATFSVCVLNEFLIKRVLFSSLSLTKLIFWSIWSICVIGLTNYLVYNYMGDWHDWSLSSALQFIMNISAVLIFPVLGTFFYFRYKNLKLQYEEILTNTEKITDEDLMIVFQGEGNNDNLTLALKDFLYAQAQDNYVEIVYVAAKSIQKQLLRSSISKLIIQVEQPLIVRSHRSYIVNLYHVRSTMGNNNIRLNINHIQQPIPVSKTYQQAVVAGIKKYKNIS